jgi:mannose-6-phosphate isomerase
MLYPLIFQARFKDRIWGGRELERLYAKKIPAGQAIGESWEISDRPGDASVITNGPLAGKDLRWLMEQHPAEVLGGAKPEVKGRFPLLRQTEYYGPGAKPAAGGRFPLLCKILDARERLSLQVHPPASKAAELKGEPKTEMWFIADAAPDACLYVGLKYGVTRAEFEKRIADGSVADCFHRIPVRAGDTMFLPSGRVHAIGDGLVIFEIQQNSDTTYRVFDWNRVGLDGRPRELHIAQSLASIDFNDFEPKLVQTKFIGDETAKVRQLVSDPLFSVEQWEMKATAPEKLTNLPIPWRPFCATTTPLANFTLQILAVVKGEVEIKSDVGSLVLSAGQFCLVPGCLKNTEVVVRHDASWLRVAAGTN